jgi:hypothetical protein
MFLLQLSFVADASLVFVVGGGTWHLMCGMSFFLLLLPTRHVIASRGTYPRRERWRAPSEPSSTTFTASSPATESPPKHCCPTRSATPRRSRPSPLVAGPQSADGGLVTGGAVELKTSSPMSVPHSALRSSLPASQAEHFPVPTAHRVHHGTGAAQQTPSRQAQAQS